MRNFEICVSLCCPNALPVGQYLLQQKSSNLYKKMLRYLFYWVASLLKCAYKIFQKII